MLPEPDAVHVPPPAPTQLQLQVSAAGNESATVEPGALLEEAQAVAAAIAAGPTFANGITKTQLHQEWSMSVDQAIESEAQAQAICMATGDFRRAFEAFAAKRKPVFEGR